MARNHEITDLLKAWSDGDTQALDKLLPLVDAELKKIAHAYLLKERPGHLMRTTALVNEALINLMGGKRIQWHSRKHFYSLVARRMRNLLVDDARKHRRRKGSGAAERVEFDEGIMSPEMSDELRLLDEALKKLAEVDELKASIVELRYFGGYTFKERAELLDITEDKVEREWRFTRSWLKREITNLSSG
jgi:RNA polymerase sigma-70 factor, ECF subfamily